jgi:hypothetical protein
MSFKRTKVVMLPTNEKASLKLGQNGLLVYNTLGYDSHFTNQHLYFLSDDEIQKDDWYINRLNSEISCCTGREYFNKVYEKKIIATTKKDLDFQDYVKTGQSRIWRIFPQPSESFIQKFIDAYNSGDPITEVMVEYNHLQSLGGLNEEWLKVNSSDNTITIRKMKDSWTREEVISLCREAINSGKDYNGNLGEKWIENNI